MTSRLRPKFTAHIFDRPRCPAHPVMGKDQGKGGVAAPSIKMSRRHLIRRGRGGSFNYRGNQSIRRLIEPPRLRPTKEASRLFITGRIHPSFTTLLSKLDRNRPMRSGFSLGFSPFVPYSKTTPFRLLSELAPSQLQLRR